MGIRGARNLATPGDSIGPVTATGSTKQRTLAERFADVVNVKDFGALGDGTTNDYSSIAAAYAATSANRSVYWPDGTYYIGTPITVPVGIKTAASSGSFVTGNGTTATAFIFSNGNHNGHHTLPSILSFSTSGIDIQGGDLANIQLRQVLATPTAVRFVTASGQSSVLDNIVRINAISGAATAVQFIQFAETDIFQGNKVYVNFVTSTNNGVKFTGPLSYCDGNSFEAAAFDIPDAQAGGALIDNQSTLSARGDLVSRFSFHVTDWCGGVGFTNGSTPSQLIKGKWDSLVFNIKSVQNWTAANMNTSPVIQAANITTHMKRTLANIVGALNVTPLAANFNGGVPLSEDSFFITITAVGGVVPGAIQNTYIYVLFPDAVHQPYIFQTVSGNGVAVMDVLSLSDESATEAGRLHFIMKNTGATNFGGTGTIQVKVFRAPLG